MKCSKCGKQLNDGNACCPECGQAADQKDGMAVVFASADRLETGFIQSLFDANGIPYLVREPARLFVPTVNHAPLTRILVDTAHKDAACAILKQYWEDTRDTEEPQNTPEKPE